MSDESSNANVININVGVLGHVDSGKTSLAKALSTHLSTASLDKNAESQKRGITIDLGFSSFSTTLPDHIKGTEYDTVQFTMVDCPGHASLIKTIIGGAQIIDMMLLVIDVTKGIQTQTAECLVIGEILCNELVVVLNKVDLLKNDEQLNKMKKKLSMVFSKTKFGKGVTMVAVSANPGGGDENLTLDGPREPGATQEIDLAKGNMQRLVDVLKQKMKIPDRISEGQFYFSIDHCFQIKGQGTVLTGTILRGSVSVNQMIELPAIGETRKVKSMQMFHKPVQKAIQGDRLGICITQVDPELIERGVACHPGTAYTLKTVVAKVEKIRFFKGAVKSGSKFHMTIGHFTTLATATFFSAEEGAEECKEGFDFSRQYVAEPELKDKPCFVVLDFVKAVTCQSNQRLIGSRLDSDIHLNQCRIAFCGDVIEIIKFKTPAEKAALKIYKMKERIGNIDRVMDEFVVIGKDLFSKETDMTQFVGMKMTLDSGEVGTIEGGFGKTGKFKVYFEDGLPKDQLIKDGGGDDDEEKKGKKKKKKKLMLKSKLHMKFKKFVYALDKKAMVQ